MFYLVSPRECYRCSDTGDAEMIDYEVVGDLYFPGKCGNRGRISRNQVELMLNSGWDIRKDLGVEPEEKRDDVSR